VEFDEEFEEFAARWASAGVCSRVQTLPHLRSMPKTPSTTASTLSFLA